MSEANMVSRLLASADDLLRTKPGSAAYRRRAVSAAYYAVFHALAGLCVKSLLPKGWTAEELLRVYRALDHGQLRITFSQTAVKDHPVLKDIAVPILNLQNERHRADYLPPDKTLFPVAEVAELMKQAQRVINIVNELDEADRRLLATCLLFKERKA
jgi:uncharacterized protein (UPF0332 family)